VAAYFGAKSASITFKHEFQRRKAIEISKLTGVDLELVPSSQCLETFSKRPPQLVIETVGGEAATAQQAVQIIEKGGKVVLLGLFSPKAPPISSFEVAVKEVHVQGTMCYCCTKEKYDFDIALDILRKYGDLLNTTLVTHILPFEKSPEAIQIALDKNNESVKVLVALDN